MKVAVFLSRFPVLSQTFVISHIVFLLKEGYEVDIYANYQSKEEIIQSSIEKYQLNSRVRYILADYPKNRLFRLLRGLKLLIKGIFSSPIISLQTLNFVRYGKAALSLELLYRASYFMAMRPKYDVIHCHFGPTGLQVSQLKSLGVLYGKIVVSLYGYDVSRSIKQNGHNYYIHLWKNADLLMPLSVQMREVINELGCPSEKIRVHHLGVDVSKISIIDRYMTKDTTLKLISISRLVEKKGLRYAVEAVGKLIQRCPTIEVQYDIVGDGPLRESLERQIVSLGLERNVRLKGWKSSAEVYNLLKEKDVLIAPSVTASDGDKEGTPVAIMEAMATGLAIISTCHSAIHEVVEDGVSGFLVEERNSEQIERKLTILYENKKLIVEMGLRGRTMIEKEYDIKALNSRLSSIYAELSDHKP